MAFDAGAIVGTLDLDKTPFQRGLEQAKKDSLEFAKRKWEAKLGLNVKEAKTNLDAIKKQADQFARSKPTATADVDTAKALAKVKALQAEIDRLNGKGVGPKTEDDSRTYDRNTRSASGYRRELGLLSGVLLALPAASATIAPLAGAAAGLGVAFASAAAGAGLFATAAKSSISEVSKQSKQIDTLRQKVYDATTTDQERAKALEQIDQITRKMSPTQRQAARDLDAYQQTWKAFTGAVQPQAFAVLHDGLGLAQTGLRNLVPVAVSAGSAIDGLIGTAKIGFRDPVWHQFFAYLGGDANIQITRFGMGVGHLATGFAALLPAFAPVEQKLTLGLLRMSVAFERWAKSTSNSGGFNDFIDYVTTEGPVLVRDLEMAGQAVASIAKALAPLGAVELQALGPMLRLVDAVARVHPGVIQAVAAIYTLRKAYTLLKLGTAVTAVRGFVGGLRGVAPAAGAAAAGSAKLGAATRSLGAALLGVRGEALTTKTALLGLAKTGGVAAVAAAGVSGFAHLGAEMHGVNATTQEMTKSLIVLGRTHRTSGALAQQWGKDLEHSAAVAGTASGSFVDNVKRLTAPSVSQQISGAILSPFKAIGLISDQNAQKIRIMDQTLAAMVKRGQAKQAAAAWQELVSAMNRQGVSTAQLVKVFPQYNRVTGGAASKNQILAQAIGQSNSRLATQAKRAYEAQNRTINYWQSVDDATSALRRNGRTLDIHTQKGRDNRRALLAVASSIQDNINELNTHSRITQKDINKIAGQRDRLVALAQKFGLSRKEAQRFAAQLVKIPKRVTPEITVWAAGRYRYGGGTGGKNSLKNPWGNKPIPANAGGALIQGAGGPRSDSMITKVSRGEFIVNAPATSRWLPFLKSINDEGNKGTPYTGRGYAGGGMPLPHRLVPYDPVGFAGGGKPEDSFEYTKVHKGAGGIDDTKSDTSNALTRMLRDSIRLTAWYASQQGGTAADERALAWAMSQSGKRYQWGGNGNPSWDCSGFMSAIESVIRGEKPHRRWATGNFHGRSGPPGWVANLKAPFMIGVTNKGAGGGHTAGTLLGVNVESNGSGGVHYGPSARGWNNSLFDMHFGFAPSIGTGGAGPNGAYNGNAKAYARSQFRQYGWSVGYNWPALDALWTKESHWNPRAANPSGAYGIPQALPGSKMASAGPDWRTNPATQIKWGESYIAGRYGNPRNAWRHSQRFNWYANGGDPEAGSWGVVGEAGPELVRFDGSATVYPHEQSMAMLAAMAGGGRIPGYAKGGRVAAIGHTRRPRRLDWGDVQKIGRALVKNLAKSLTGSEKEIAKAGAKIRRDLVKGFARRPKSHALTVAKREVKQLEALAKRRDALSKNASAAKTLQSSVISGAKDFSALTNLGTVYNAATVQQSASNQLKTITEFATNIAKLKKMGLSKTLLSQIVNAGPDQGNTLARAILLGGGKGTISQLNKTYGQIDKAAGVLGNNAAAAVYGDRISKGFVAGMGRQEKALQRQMDRLAARLVKQLKGKFGIRVGKHGTLRALASGGDAYPGELALVGERGPEFVEFRQRAHVYTAEESQAMAHGGRSVTINNTIIGADAAQIAERASQQTLSRVLMAVGPV